MRRVLCDGLLDTAMLWFLFAFFGMGLLIILMLMVVLTVKVGGALLQTLGVL